MNSFLAILFVAGMTILGKWLLFDQDAPDSEPAAPDLQIAEAPTDEPEFPLSKSA